MIRRQVGAEGVFVWRAQFIGDLAARSLMDKRSPYKRGIRVQFPARRFFAADAASERLPHPCATVVPRTQAAPRPWPSGVPRIGRARATLIR